MPRAPVRTPNAAQQNNGVHRSTPTKPNKNDRVHDRDYIDHVLALSSDHSKAIHRLGDESAFAPGGFEIAALAAGGAVAAAEAVLRGEVANAYALSRPPGHHAERGVGGGCAAICEGCIVRVWAPCWARGKKRFQCTNRVCRRRAHESTARCSSSLL